MQSTTNNVCNHVVAADLCIGCGLCAGICPTGTLEMRWDAKGLLIPTDRGNCAPKCRMCLEVCPFMSQNKNEDTLANDIFDSNLRRSANVGYYSNCYVGHAEKGYRDRGASGGMASWFMAALLEQGVVDHVVCVRRKADPQCLYEYALLSTPGEVRSASKSAYYPVELSTVIHHILRSEGRYALIGLPCFIKAVRLATTRIPLLKRRLIVMAGLVCGQTKSRMFSSYLVHQMDLDPAQINEVVFRNKLSGNNSNNFEIRAKEFEGRTGSLPWHGVYSNAWTSGMFSPRACSFCDDIFAELADISFMDAWLPKFIADSAGASLVVCRSGLAQLVVSKGIESYALSIESISVERVEESQVPVTEWKRRDLSWRLWLAKEKQNVVPLKRIVLQRPNLWHAGRLLLRESLRRFSLAKWDADCVITKAERHVASKAIQRKLAIYLLYLSVPQWILRAKRLPRWIWRKTGISGRFHFGNKVPKFSRIGVGCQIHDGYFGAPERIAIGNYVYIGPQAYIGGLGGVEIGDGTIIAMRVIIRSSTHRYDGSDLASLPFDDVALLKRVCIGECVWIGDHVLICPGVTIGEGSIVAMGSVVSKDVPPLSVVAGNPARVVKIRDRSRYQKLKAAGKLYWKEREIGRLGTDFEIRAERVL